MTRLWLTYAWVDNENSDVDFVAQELESTGVQVRIDRRHLSAGKRLWSQIERFIVSSEESDAWAIYATENSLRSEACQEELSYALDRALHTRGHEFTLIGIFPTPVDRNLIPKAISSRVYVSLTDSDWKERVAAAVEGRAVQIARDKIAPFELQIHRTASGYLIEMRPRAGVWHPCAAAIPIAEKDATDPSIFSGPSGSPPMTAMVSTGPSRPSDDDQWWTMKIFNQVTPTTSLFMQCSELPSKLAFGSGNNSLYLVKDLTRFPVIPSS